MIESAVRLQRRHGVAGTAFADVLADSGAPRGSVYHHFPGGRAQLSELATRRSAEAVAENLEAWLADDVMRALDGLLPRWTHIMTEDEHYLSGCTVAAGALDPAPDSAARTAAAEGLHHWEDLLASALETHVGDERARGLAVTCLAAIEGALIFVRAERSLRPLELVGEQLRALFHSALGAA
ncbi:TetR/AcrR family transcriptional regulator [Streptomyces sp. NPDC102274]|uniref:TetR/AcrR family transcriptional regulator n=1 Tax=Streptomyces sp. NPDC102274 TaxID=3366151 RepID=UPI0038092239